MIKRIKRPSATTLIAWTALFISLGGTSWAVATLPANSVGNKQIKNGAVNGPKIKNDAVDGAKIKNGSVGVADMAPGGISAAHTMTSSGSKILSGNMIVGSMPLPAGSYSIHARVGINDVTGGTTVVACTMSSFFDPGGSTLDFQQRQFMTGSYATSQGYVEMRATATFSKSGYVQLRCLRAPEVGTLTVVESKVEAVRNLTPHNTVFPLS